MELLNATTDLWGNPLSRKDEVRRRIAMSAIACYECNGVRKTSISAIARHAGLTRELIYYYFANKDEITSYVCGLYRDQITLQILRWAKKHGRGPLHFIAAREFVGVISNLAFKGYRVTSPMIRVLEEIDSVSSCIYAVCGDILEHSPQGFVPWSNQSEMAFFMLGILGCLRGDPRMSEEQIAHLLVQMSSVGVAL